MLTSRNIILAVLVTLVLIFVLSLVLYTTGDGGGGPA
jgi:hypothetical protein